MLRRCVWSRNIKNGCSIYIYDISHLRVKLLVDRCSWPVDQVLYYLPRRRLVCSLVVCTTHFCNKKRWRTVCQMRLNVESIVIYFQEQFSSSISASRTAGVVLNLWRAKLNWSSTFWCRRCLAETTKIYSVVWGVKRLWDLNLFSQNNLQETRKGYKFYLISVPYIFFTEASECILITVVTVIHFGFLWFMHTSFL